MKYHLGINKFTLAERADPADEIWQTNQGWQAVFRKRAEYARQFARNKTCLDLCCGTGWTTYEIGKIATHVVGIDYADEAIAAAKSKYSRSNIDYKVMNAQSLQLADEAFDVVVCMEAIEHFSQKDGLQVLRETHRVLKTGGILIGSTPAINDRNPLLLRLLKLRDPYHLFLYSESLLREALSSVFATIDIEQQHEGWLLFKCWKHEKYVHGKSL
ncbi:MAG: class I SAM-dependent methyltransferase [bacterium]